jgi:pyruvate dehydrogenase E2 component (dihydrolipoamide acetyltransferase)
MAKIDVVMPQMGESITTGTITKWHKSVGDKIDIDEVLFEISTDKVESEIPASMDGRISAILFEEGETIDVGVKIAEIEDDASVDISAGGASAATATAAPVKAKAVEVKEESVAAPNPAAAEVSTSSTGFYTPLVKAMAKDHGVALSELDNIKGSGSAGRVNKKDFLAFLETRGSAPVTAAQVKAAAPVKAVSAPAATGDRVEIIPMSNMRKAIAKNMVLSKQTSPHVNSIVDVDVTNLVKIRETIKNHFKKSEGFGITYTHFILYALIQALKEFPLVNSSIDGDNIIMKKDINLGCAVAVPGNGLVVPVIKNADSLNLTGLARALKVLVDKAQNKKLTLDDISGGTYTFTNNGSFGVIIATPVILQPQVGIFCAGIIKKMPVVIEENAIAIRDIMYLTHTYDHRIVDGELGSKFLMFVKNYLENMDPREIL